MMTFSDFIFKKFKSFSHGHEHTHEEVDGLYYTIADYNRALEKYDDYKFNQHLKGLKHEKGDELAGRNIKRNSSNRLSQRGKSSIRSL